MAAGVYAITCLPTNEKYVGGSDNVPKRWDSHRHQLRTGKHPIQLLQDRWTQYGEEQFSFSLLETVSDQKLEDREKYYIQTLNPVFNTSQSTAKQHSKKKLTTTIRITEDLYEELKQASNVLRRSQSDIISKALKEYLDKNPLGPTYSLHIFNKYAILVKKTGFDVHYEKVKELNGSTPEQEAETYSKMFGVPVRLIFDSGEGEELGL